MKSRLLLHQGIAMDRMRLTQQGFERLSQSFKASLVEATADRVEAWLRGEVYPVVAKLARNRSNQLTVRWSVDHFSLGVDTSERRLVEDMGQALVHCAVV